MSRRTFVMLYLENIQLQYFNCMSHGLNLAISNCVEIFLICDCFGIIGNNSIFNVFVLNSFSFSKE